MGRWPRDNQAELIKFYGTPGPEVEAQLVPVVPPFKMYYEGKGKPIAQIMFHRKAAPALRAALNEMWDACGHDQKIVDKLGLSSYDGAYNKRMVRGSATKWSNHSFGAAIDINAAENGMRTHGNMPKLAIEAFKRQGARWGGDYHGRKDPMHFEFCDNGEHPVTRVVPSSEDVADDETADRDEAEDNAADTGDTEASPIKHICKSKIAALGSTVGLGGGGLAIGEVSDVMRQAAEAKDQAKGLGLWDLLMRLAENPKFMFLAGLTIAGVAIVYFRWRDHGGGKRV